MNSVARISYRGGALVMPARSLYDRELVFEQAEFYARRDGKTRLELNHKEVVVSVVSDSSGRACSRSGIAERQLAFVASGHTLCRHCARALPN